MATLIEILNEQAPEPNPATHKLYVQLLLHIADIADRMLTYDVGPMPTKQMSPDEFQTLFHEVMGVEHKQELKAAIRGNAKIPDKALMHCVASDTIVHALMGLKERSISMLVSMTLEAAMDPRP